MGRQNGKRPPVAGAVTIQGLLVPDRWDAEGVITGVALLTGDEEKYLVQPDSGLESLLPLLRSRVELVGTVQLRQGEKIFFARTPPLLLSG
ncbi:MAG: hypothetical protein C0613_03695 [Desulfobulbaceae bacterium]|nr:MAG: hypothetical protein C0613_03695 [Desulfobulbaceae bacterium]